MGQIDYQSTVALENSTKETNNVNFSCVAEEWNGLSSTVPNPYSHLKEINCHAKEVKIRWQKS